MMPTDVTMANSFLYSEALEEGKVLKIQGTSALVSFLSLYTAAKYRRMRKKWIIKKKLLVDHSLIFRCLISCCDSEQHLEFLECSFLNFRRALCEIVSLRCAQNCGFSP